MKNKINLILICCFSAFAQNRFQSEDRPAILVTIENENTKRALIESVTNNTPPSLLALCQITNTKKFYQITNDDDIEYFLQVTPNEELNISDLIYNTTDKATILPYNLNKDTIDEVISNPESILSLSLLIGILEEKPEIANHRLGVALDENLDNIVEITEQFKKAQECELDLFHLPDIEFVEVERDLDNILSVIILQSYFNCINQELESNWRYGLTTLNREKILEVKIEHFKKASEIKTKIFDPISDKDFQEVKNNPNSDISKKILEDLLLTLESPLDPEFRYGVIVETEDGDKILEITKELMEIEASKSTLQK